MELTATYKHKKDPVEVTLGSKVKYNLAIYNEGRLLNEQIKELQLSKDDANDDINRAYADINETKNNMFRSFLDNESLTEEDKKYKAKLEKFQENVKNDLRIDELTEKRKEYDKAGVIAGKIKAVAGEED